MNDFENEKIIKEMLKKILEDNGVIPLKAKTDLKAIIEMEHNPERLLLECLLYMFAYHS